MATADNWEEEIIENILKITKGFIKRNNLNLFEIAEGIRDGGYIQFINRKKDILITFYYLPNYDVTVEQSPRNLKTIFKVFKAIFKNEDNIENFFSLKAELNEGEPIANIEDFLNNCFIYIEENFKLQ